MALTKVGYKLIKDNFKDAVSGSWQGVVGSGSLGMVSGSAISTASFGRLESAGNANIVGNLVAGGTITAQEFHTEFVSASITFTSGSHKFGDDADDIHQLTGSTEFSGSVKIGTSLTDVHHITGSTRASGSIGINGAPTNPLHTIGSLPYASTATNLSTSTTAAAARIQGSNNSSTSIWAGTLANDAQTYLQACNGAGNAADDLVLNPFGGKVGIGIGNASPDSLIHAKVTTNTSETIRIQNDDSLTTIGVSSDGYTFHTYQHSLYWASWDGSTWSTKARMDSDGKLLIGGTTSRALSGVNSHLQVEGTTYNSSGAHLIGNTGTDAGTAPILFFGRSRGTSNGSSTVVADDDRLGALFFCGADGTDINTPAATIQVSVDGTPGGNDMPGRIEFRTTADGASSTTERMRITSAGYIGIGTTSPSGSLHLSTTGTQIMYLEGDSNNSGQEDCYIKFLVDGKTQEAYLGWDNNNSTPLFSSNTENTFVMGTKSNLPVLFATNNTERMQITAAGNVGIGTDSPDTKFHVYMAADSEVYWGQDSAGVYQAVGSNQHLRFLGDAGSTEIMRLEDGGDVGIGTNNPVARLHVKDAHSNAPLVQFEFTGGGGKIIAFVTNGSENGDISEAAGTVSLNGFQGAHQTNIAGSSDTTIKEGTVISTTDILYKQNHPQCKISDTENDTRVYGVLSRYVSGSSDFVVASVGVGSVRVTGSCAGGDLLVSAGDGCAKVNNSGTLQTVIGKVTSNVSGSATEDRLIPCVLYCG